MANYNVDIGVKVQAQQLDKFNKKIKLTDTLIDKANKSIKNYQKGNLELVRSIDGVNIVLKNASENFRKVAVGTPQATRAAKEFVKAEKLVNKTLIEQEKLLETIRRKQQGKDFTMGLRRQGFKKNQIKQSDGTFINQRRAELRIMNRAATLEERINQTLLKRGKILSANGKQIKSNNVARSAGGRGGGFQNALSSGLIGGGFPLLFGQGATAALGGGIGGVAGGLIGGQFGFALSIAGTTIGNALDQLSKALVKPTENIEMLVNKLGLAGTETGDLALRLERLGLESDAAKLLLKKFEDTFGLTADEIKENAETLKNFNNEINKLGTSLTLMMANVLNPLIKELNNLIEGKKPEGISRGVTGTVDFFTANALDLDKRGNIFDEVPDLLKDLPNPFKKSRRMSNIPAGEETVNNPDFGKPGFLILPPIIDPLKPFKDKANEKFQTEEIIPLKQALEIEQKRLTTSADKLNLMKQEFELVNLDNQLKDLMAQRTNEENIDLEEKIQKLKIVRDTQAQVVKNTEALIDPTRQITQMFAQDMSNAIKGLIQGTETLNDALSNVLNKLADAFLNMALFGNTGGSLEKGGGIFGSIFGGFLANGGQAKAGKPYMVGERGAELFVPKTSGTVIPNHELGGMSSSTNIVVNVDASGSSVEGDEEQGRELGDLISSAIQSELIKQKRPGGLLG